jgi:predicted secreted Zn-dependent protease
MIKTSRNLIFLLLPLLLLGLMKSVTYAEDDSITLKEGKVIKGTIISDEDGEITIKLGSKMYLKVDKSKIRSINRAPVKEPEAPQKKTEPFRPKMTSDVSSGPVISTHAVTTSTTSLNTQTSKSMATSPATAAPAATGPVAPKPVVPKPDIPKPVVPPPIVKPAAPPEGALTNLPATTTFHSLMADIGKIDETLTYEPYQLTASNFEEAREEIYETESGKGFKSGFKREASKVTQTTSWSGDVGRDGALFKWKKLLFQPALTVQYPYWEPAAKVNQDSVAKWEVFLKDLKKHDAGHLEIYRESIHTMLASLSSLQASSEADLRKMSGQIVEEIRSRYEKKQNGYDRRSQDESLSKNNLGQSPKKN